MEIKIDQFIRLIRPPRPKGRGQWIRDFYGELWRGWNSVKSEPLTLRTLAIRMRNVPDSELPVLWKLCKESESFSKFFWWRIKKYPPKKKEKKPKQETLLWRRNTQ